MITVHIVDIGEIVENNCLIFLFVLTTVDRFRYCSDA